MSYYSSFDAKNLAIVYENDISFNFQLKLIEEALMNKVVSWFKNMKTTTKEELQKYFFDKFKTDLSKSGQPTTNVEGFLKEWLVRNFLIITDVNGNTNTKPEWLADFRKGEEDIKNNPSAYLTTTGMNYLNAYKDIWVKEVLEDWAMKYGRVSASGGSFGSLASTTVNLETVRNLINSVLNKIIVMAETQIRIDPRLRAPSGQNMPYMLLKSGKVSGSTTLGDMWNQAGTGYYGKNVKLISLLPGSGNFDSILTSIYSSSGSSSPTYSSPFDVSADQAKTGILNVFSSLSSDPRFTSYFSSTPAPVASDPPLKLALALLKFIQHNDDQAKAAFKLLFPKIAIP